MQDTLLALDTFDDDGNPYSGLGVLFRGWEIQVWELFRGWEIQGWEIQGWELEIPLRFFG
jgi:hypothetical protein